MRVRPLSDKQLAIEILYGTALVATSCAAIWLAAFAFNLIR
jgi:hypothetical protein